MSYRLIALLADKQRGSVAGINVASIHLIEPGRVVYAFETIARV